MNSLVAYIQPYLIKKKKIYIYIYIQPYYSQVVKKIIFNLVVVCEKKKIMREKRKRIILFIILLNFYLFKFLNNPINKISKIAIDNSNIFLFIKSKEAMVSSSPLPPHVTITF